MRGVPYERCPLKMRCPLRLLMGSTTDGWEVSTYERCSLMRGIPYERCSFMRGVPYEKCPLNMGGVPYERCPLNNMRCPLDMRGVPYERCFFTRENVTNLYAGLVFYNQAHNPKQSKLYSLTTVFIIISR